MSSLPLEEKTHEVMDGDRFDARAQAVNGEVMDTSQQGAVAPLQALQAGVKGTPQDGALAFQRV